MSNDSKVEIEFEWKSYTSLVFKFNNRNNIACASGVMPEKNPLKFRRRRLQK